VFDRCELSDQLPARFALTLFLLFDGKSLVERRGRERAAFALSERFRRDRWCVVEGRREFYIAAEMALVGEWGKRARGASQAEKEDERVRVQDVQEVYSEVVVQTAFYPQATRHDCAYLL
jgi:hypothetical protein